MPKRRSSHETGGQPRSHLLANGEHGSLGITSAGGPKLYPFAPGARHRASAIEQPNMHAASRPSSRSQGIRQANPLRSTGASICAIAFASGFDGEPRAIVAANAVLVGMARDGVMKLAPHISQRATRCAADRTVLCLLSLDRSLDCGATIPLKIECKASNVIGQNAGQNVVSSGIGVPHNLLSLLINLCECCPS